MKPLTKTQISTLQTIKAAGNYPLWHRQKGYNLNAVYALKEMGLVRYERINDRDGVMAVEA